MIRVVGGSDENILLLVVSGALGVMRVAQIVDGVDERLVVPLELVHHFAQILRCDGIETEMHVKYLKVVAVFGHPARLEHQRWPPTTRNLPPIARHRIRQSADCVDTSRFGKVTDVDMRRRHRSHSQHFHS